MLSVLLDWASGKGRVSHCDIFLTLGCFDLTANYKPCRWDDWVPQERLRKLTEENKELASNLKKDMDAQRRAATGKPAPPSVKKKAYGADLSSSTRGSEDRSSAAPQAPRGTKRGREIEGIDKVSFPRRYSTCLLQKFARPSSATLRQRELHSLFHILSTSASCDGEEQATCKAFADAITEKAKDRATVALSYHSSPCQF